MMTITITVRRQRSEDHDDQLETVSTEAVECDGRSIRRLTRQAAERVAGDSQSDDTLHATATRDGREVAYSQITA